MSAFACIFGASFLCATHDTRLLVVEDTLLKEVCFSGERDVLHD